MFGISLAEFFVIAVVAMAVIPAKNWPDVFRALGRLVKFVRELVWKITDATEQIKDQVERELPMDEIMKKTTEDITGAFAEPFQNSSGKRARRRQVADQGSRKRAKQ
jgi:Sec-independent protein translocase protein TatA